MIDKLIQYNQVLMNPDDEMIVATDGGPHLIFHFCKNDYSKFITQIEDGFQREEIDCLKCSE